MIVPTRRRTGYLWSAIGLARELGSVLVVLCSGDAPAPEVARMGDRSSVGMVVVEVGESAINLPPLATTSVLEGTGFASQSDLSIKRNLGLLLARGAGWERILFLDDDMLVRRSADVRTAAGLLDEYDAVGLQNVGYPDHSVVCRINRMVGSEQQQFIGAGALVVAPAKTQAFFPDVYCEDWFYFIGQGEPPRLAIWGKVAQRVYDPFEDPTRARGEELGDSLAEGLYWLLDERVTGQSVLQLADATYWADFLVRRRSFIGDLLDQVQRLDRDTGLWERRAMALKHALDVNKKITPDLCVRYLDAWRADLEDWRRVLTSFDASATGTVDDTVAQLGLTELTRH